jgi:hypothetical protein
MTKPWHDPFALYNLAHLNRYFSTPPRSPSRRPDSPPSLHADYDRHFMLGEEGAALPVPADATAALRVFVDHHASTLFPGGVTRTSTASGWQKKDGIDAQEAFDAFHAFCKEKWPDDQAVVGWFDKTTGIVKGKRNFGELLRPLHLRLFSPNPSLTQGLRRYLWRSQEDADAAGGAAAGAAAAPHPVAVAPPPLPPAGGGAAAPHPVAVAPPPAGDGAVAPPPPPKKYSMACTGQIIYQFIN